MAILFNKWLAVGFFTLFFSFNTEKNAWHPYHVSSTECEYNAEEKRVEITSKIFTDDFEAVLSKLYKAKPDFANPALKTQMNELVKRYITTHLALRTNGRLMRLQLYGWELDIEAVYVYTTANASGFDAKNISIENTILYDQFNDQMNIVHFIVNKERKSAKLNYPERKVQFSF